MGEARHRRASFFAWTHTSGRIEAVDAALQDRPALATNRMARHRAANPR